MQIGVVLPDTPKDRDIDRERLVNFLQKKGSIELLIVVSEGGARYKELVSKTSVADSTLNKRRAEAVELNLITTDSDAGTEGMNHYYVLEPLGQVIRKFIEHHRLTQVFWKLQERRNEYAELSSEVIEAIAETDEEELEQIRDQMLQYEDFDQLNPDQDSPFDGWL